MSDRDNSLEVPKNIRARFIDEVIAPHLSAEQRDSGKDRADRIVGSYAGADRDAISILAYAAERGKFDEFAEKLEKYHADDLNFVHPDARRVAAVPGAIKAARFFMNCYEELGIKPVAAGS
jgi:hypothetical protein